MRRAVVFQGTVGREWMIQSKSMWVSEQMVVLEESVGTAIETKQMDIRAKP